jgi:hypothetical protein
MKEKTSAATARRGITYALVAVDITIAGEFR